MLVATGAKTVTITELATRVRNGRSLRGLVAITFDDGFVSVVTHALPLLTERDLVGTVFCVAGHLGGTNDWPTQPAGAQRSPLAGAAELRELAGAGFEVGAHGMEHAPLVASTERELERELVESRRVLEDEVGASVTSVAYPYGAPPRPSARALVEATYAAGCTTRITRVAPGTDPYSLPRIDAHYVRRPAVLRAVVEGRLDAYLSFRRRLAHVRRLVRSDYARAGTPG